MFSVLFQGAAVINEIHTDVVCTNFSNKLFIVVTQFCKLGTLVIKSFETFPQASVILFTRGGMRGGGGHAWQGGMHGRVACVAGGGVCGVGGMHGRGGA